MLGGAPHHFLCHGPEAGVAGRGFLNQSCVWEENRRTDEGKGLLLEVTEAPFWEVFISHPRSALRRDSPAVGLGCCRESRKMGRTSQALPPQAVPAPASWTEAAQAGVTAPLGNPRGAVTPADLPGRTLLPSGAPGPRHPLFRGVTTEPPF